MKWSLSAIAACLGAELNPPTAGEQVVSAFSINTRTLQAGEVYIALKGKVFDGHDFAEQAVQAGAAAIICAQPLAVAVPTLIVPDTHEALGQLASAWRLQANVLMAGVTGSNGKTTVKEMLAAILGVNAPVLYTQGNLNNDIGVPLTLLRLQNEHRYAVIEMGANHAGEIAYTSECAKADVVVITNVGDAHLEGFGDAAGIARAKGEIIETLKAGGVAILNRGDHFYDYWKNLAGSRRTVSFGFDAAADFSAVDISSGITGHTFMTEFTLVAPTGRQSMQLSLAGRHNVLNAIAASAAASALGVGLAQIRQSLAQVQAVKGRLNPLIGCQGNLLIDDTYNANPASLAAALAVLQECPGESWLALGAFGELGADSFKIHADLAALIKHYGVTRLFATGADTQATVAAFGTGAQYFASQADLIQTLGQVLTPAATLLIKGSRAQRMENVALSLTNSIGN